MTDVQQAESLPGTPWVRRFPVRTPTLPPATHTNAWIVGARALAVIDPASPYPEEQAALDAYLDGLVRDGARVVALVLTHHHGDHVGGAMHLRARLGVPVLAHADTARLCDGRVVVDRLVADGERVVLDEDCALEALHTPGHAPGHLCFVESRARAVVAGDMVASVGTIIVDPTAEGDMRLYLASLARLRALDAKWLLPAHGAPVDDPARLLDLYVRHRLMRESLVASALAKAGPAPVEELLPHAYADTPEGLWPLAARSLLAHLVKLRDEGRAVEKGGLWQVAA